jgi:hypothetical protein
MHNPISSILSFHSHADAPQFHVRCTVPKGEFRFCWHFLRQEEEEKIRSRVTPISQTRLHFYKTDKNTNDENTKVKLIVFHNSSSDSGLYSEVRLVVSVSRSVS